jgi:hypothetical protein
MDIAAILYAFGATGFFTSRAFVPAWATAVVLRYGDMMPVLKQVPYLQSTGAEPTWFTHNGTILLLTILAALEVAADKSPEARELLAGIQRYAKSAIAAVATLGVFGVNDLNAARDLLIHTAGMFDTVIGGLVAASVYVSTWFRQSVMDLLTDADPDDSLGIQKLISWGEDVWGVFGVVFFFLYPLLIITLVLVLLGGMYAIRKYCEHREDRSRVACAACGALMYPSASHCPACKTANPSVQAIGFFGTALNKPAADLTKHRFALATKRRCMTCAGRLKERRLPQVCPDCHTQVLASADDQAAYLQTVAARFPRVLGITFGLSLLPVIGIIPGIIYYRVQLLAPFRVYIPATQGFFLKWAMRLVFMLLISLQVVPGAGGLALPIMASISYVAYRSLFKRQLARTQAVAGQV